ncbi:hypothetical protein BDQ17DRAFT_1239718 [Cyathus striatus]|nr:hypothetical protein BDQ17DRAFT_1239718 [Cyathus striatus]
MQPFLLIWPPFFLSYTCPLRASHFPSALHSFFFFRPGAPYQRPERPISLLAFISFFAKYFLLQNDLPSFLILAIVSASVLAAPTLHSKRIAQIVDDSTVNWENACLAAGGAQKCNPVSVTAFSTLLAAAGSCDQQDSADAMIDLAKSLNSDADMIKFAQIFAQQPRNTPTSQSVPYCQTAPKNAELNGLFQCQFAGADPKTFVGGIAVGGAGTIPFGQSSPLSPSGSCPANPSGPISDGSQLVDITQNPGVGAVKGSGSQAGNDSSSGIPTSTLSPTSMATAVSGGSAVAGGSSFALQNGKDAQALNAKFAKLTTDSSCDDGEDACVGTSFAQCVGGKFILSSCGTDVVCAALPLVNSPGTSVTCARPADVLSRIQATGATGGITGA